MDNFEDQSDGRKVPEEDTTGSSEDLVEGVDYYLENGLLVFTSTFLLKRGYCCESGCRHCPYKD